MPQRICTGSIMGTLVYDTVVVKDKRYRYKVTDNISAVDLLNFNVVPG